MKTVPRSSDLSPPRSRNGRRRASGLAGIVQINVDRPGRRRCDMMVEDLSSGERVRISQDRGEMARGCRLDHGVLAAVVSAVEASLLRDVDILIINKFGKEEVEGRGFRHAIALALENETPVLIGVPARNAEAWRAFCGDDAVATTRASDELRVAGVGGRALSLDGFGFASPDERCFRQTGI